MDDTRLGALLLEGGIVDEAGLERCLAIQSLTGHVRPIGQILVDQGLVTAEVLERLLELQRQRRSAQADGARATDLSTDALLALAAREGAAELMVSEGRPAAMRVGLAWRPLTDAPLSGPEVWDFARSLMGHGVLEALAERRYVVQPWQSVRAGRGLAMAFRQLEGVAVRATFVPAAVPDPSLVGVPPVVVDAVRAGRGLVLLVGERGLGRTELVTALLPLLSTDRSQHVVVVDDEPLLLPTNGALVVRRRFGIDPDVRARALQAALAEDPDALVVADIGERRTFELALRAAEGGRLVVAWIDARNAVQALARLCELPAPHDAPRVRAALAAVLRAVLVRQLLPAADGGGAVAATEVLVVDQPTRDAIRDDQIADVALLMRADGRAGGPALDRSLLDLVAAGRVRIEDVFARAADRGWLLDRAQALATKAN
jgi:twitching motility protein PilT